MHVITEAVTLPTLVMLKRLLEGERDLAAFNIAGPFCSKPVLEVLEDVVK